jgi:hypothetical protein
MKQDIIKKIDSVLNEADGDSVGEDMVKELRDSIKAIFPKSFVDVSFRKILGDNYISINFALGADESEWANRIIDNDPSLTRISIDALDGELGEGITLPEKLDVRLARGGRLLVKPDSPHLAFSAVKTGWRNKKGTPEQITKHTINYFEKLKQTIKANLDNMTDEHKEIAQEKV